MGAIAEDILDGTCCAICGQYFRNHETDELYTHGYPVMCDDCYHEGAQGYDRAEVMTF